MNDDELEKLVKAWLIVAENGPGSQASFDNDWAFEEVCTLGEDPEFLWRFILMAYTQPMSDRACAFLAAGPIEDLLSTHGPDYISRVSELAQKDKLFNCLLGGVWITKNMSDEVATELERVRQCEW